MKRVALYARVSTPKQAQERTIESQLHALKRYAQEQGYRWEEKHIYRDEGYSGARLDRPALDRLRDEAAAGLFDAVLVLSPDRLARRYAYQVLLVEELERWGCEVIFLERPIAEKAEDRLLLEIQGAFAEYERARSTTTGPGTSDRSPPWGSASGPSGPRRSGSGWRSRPGSTKTSSGRPGGGFSRTGSSPSGTTSGGSISCGGWSAAGSAGGR